MRPIEAIGLGPERNRRGRWMRSVEAASNYSKHK
jgi:hypothetical protein